MPSLNRAPRSFHLCVILTWSFAVLAGVGTSWAAPPQDQTGGYTSAESFVRAKLLAGNIADLRIFSPKDPKGRALSSEFLDELLLDKSLKQTEEDWSGIRIEGAVFTDLVDIHRVFPWPVWLNDCEFLNDVDFSRSHFTGGLSLAGSTFHGISAFRHMEVGDDLVLRTTTFEKSADFTETTVNGTFYLDGSKFLNSAKDSDLADFDSIVVKGTLTFLGANSERVLAMPEIQTRNLVLGGLQAPKLDLSGGLIQNDLKATPFKVDDIVFDSLKVSGFSYLQYDRSAQLSNSLDFRGTSFGTLQMELPGNVAKANAKMDGMTYQELRADEGVDSWASLSDLLAISPYSADPYLRLEAFLRSHGLDEAANDTLVSRMRRERKTLSYISFNFWWSLVQDLLVRYGSRPLRPVIVCLVLILIGTFMFNRRKDMELQDPKAPDRYYSPFWYSVDLLFPVIDLQFKNVWMPRQDWRWGRIYAQVHRVLGWIFTTLALATLHGVFK
jgi:hypothetical protein